MLIISINLLNVKNKTQQALWLQNQQILLQFSVAGFILHHNNLAVNKKR